MTDPLPPGWLTETEALAAMARIAVEGAPEAGRKWAAVAALEIGGRVGEAHAIAGSLALDVIEHLEKMADCASASADQRRVMIEIGVGAFRAELGRLVANAYPAARA